MSSDLDGGGRPQASFEDEAFCSRLELAAFAGLSLRGELERWIPGFVTPVLEAEHLARYAWAAERVAGKRVLDAACGAGKGSAMLAEAGASSVVGLDLGPDIVRYAQARYARPGVEFLCGDVVRFEPERPFDTIVSFETIEHVPDVGAYLANMARIMAADGEFLVSTPISSLAHDVRPENPFHVQEWGMDAFTALLSDKFRVTEAYVQLAKEPRNYLRRCLNGLGLARAAFTPFEIRLGSDYEPRGRPGVKYRGYQVLVCRRR